MAWPGVVLCGLYVLFGSGTGILVCMCLYVTGRLMVVVLVASVDVIVVDGGRIILAVVEIVDVGGGVVWA